MRLLQVFSQLCVLVFNYFEQEIDLEHHSSPATRHMVSSSSGSIRMLSSTEISLENITVYVHTDVSGNYTISIIFLFFCWSISLFFWFCLRNLFCSIMLPFSISFLLLLSLCNVISFVSLPLSRIFFSCYFLLFCLSLLRTLFTSVSLLSHFTFLRFVILFSLSS